MNEKTKDRIFLTIKGLISLPFIILILPFYTLGVLMVAQNWQDFKEEIKDLFFRETL